MKVLLVHCFYQFRGGEDNYFDSVQKLLRKNGQQVIAYSKDNRHLQSVFQKILVALGLFFSPLVALELSQIIRRERPNVAHFGNLYPAIGDTAYWICRWYKIPIIQRVPSFRYLCPKATLYRNNQMCELCTGKNFKTPAILYGCYSNSRLGTVFFVISQYFHRLIGSYKQAAVYIFQAEFVRDYFLQKTSIPRSKTVVLRHFVPTTSLSKPISQKQSFIYVGRLAEEKGILQLIQVFKQLPNSRLTIVGTGPLEKEVRLFTRAKNLRYYGQLTRQRVLKEMRNSIATIIPSRWYETGPFVLMESFSVGTPVIAPNFGVFINQVKDNYDGVLFDLNSLNSLKEKIRYLDQNIKIAAKMGKNAYTTFEEHYTENYHYEELVKTYQKALRQKTL